MGNCFRKNIRGILARLDDDAVKYYMYCDTYTMTAMAHNSKSDCDSIRRNEEIYDLIFTQH